MSKDLFKNLSTTGFIEMGKGRYKYSRFLVWRSVGYIVTEKQKSLISQSMYEALRNTLLALMVIIFFGGLLDVNFGYRFLGILFCAGYFSYINEKYVGDILSKCEKIKDERGGFARFAEHLSNIENTLTWKQILSLIFMGFGLLLFVALLLTKLSLREDVFSLIFVAIVGLISIVDIVIYSLLLFMKWKGSKAKEPGR